MIDEARVVRDLMGDVHRVMGILDMVTLAEFVSEACLRAGLREDAVVGWNVGPLEQAVTTDRDARESVRGLVDSFLVGMPEDADAVGRYAY